MMRHALVATLFIAAMGLAAMTGPTFAQDATPPPAATPETVVVPVGPFDFDVDPAEPLTACVIGRDETLELTTVTVQVLVRVESGDYVPVLSYTTEATGPLENAGVEDCTGLAAIP